MCLAILFVFLLTRYPGRDSLSFMMLLNELKLRARHIAMPVIMVTILAYFGYHAIQGNHGLRAHKHLTQEITELQQKADVLHAKKETMKRRVALLRPDNLDPDLLAERAREVLGYAHPDDIILLDPQDSAVRNSK